jgi:LPXTG-motif cell wall-anchored protein
MRRGVIRSGAVAVGVLSLSGAGAFAAALPAYAAPACPATTPAATLIPGTDICEIRIGAPGGTFTFPSSLVKVSAVLVGAGAAGFYESFSDAGYAGEGGQVVYIDAVALDVPHTVVVGAGGSSGDGGDTSIDAVVAAGGSITFGTDGADGAGGAGTDNVGGPGLLAEDVATDTTLFPAGPAAGADLTVYGQGGDGFDSDVPDPIPATALTSPGSGGHGLVASTSDAAPGIDGIVILRFAAQEPAAPPPAPAPSAPTLPDTGFDATPGLVAASGLIVAGGLAVALGRRRRRGTAA